MKLLLIALLSAFFFSLTYSSAPTEFNTHELNHIVLLLLLVLGLEAFLASPFKRYKNVQNLIYSCFAIANILSINLILNESFVNLPGYVTALVLLLAIFILFTFMKMVDENVLIARLLAVLMFIATSMVLGQVIFSSKQKLATSLDQESISEKNMKYVEFKSKPNVYFIGFDSIMPKALLQKHLGIETTAYHDVLDADFRRFRNFFADAVPTKPSLNSLLALDKRYFFSVEGKYGFFSGQIPSPLLEIFRYNGYDTNTFFKGSYFGREKGPYVDNYLGTKEKSTAKQFGVCQFIDASLYPYTFLGYCKLSDILSKSGENMEDIDLLIEAMQYGVYKGTPQVFVAYIYSPGHTPKKFDRNDQKSIVEYRESYIKASKKTAKHIKKLVSFITNEDPNGIVYIFGDHGPWISRRDTFKDDPVFFIQDRYGTYGGIYPDDRCAESFSKPYNSNFTTVLQGAHMILRCLSGGESIFLKQEVYDLPSFGQKTRRYEDYLYE